MLDKNMTQSTQLKLSKLCDKMRHAGYKESYIAWLITLVNELQKKDVRYLDRFVGKLLKIRLNSKDAYDAYLDIVKEGRFALALARSGFKQIEIEYSDIGPDVKARYNRLTVYFEITRKRESEEEKAIHRSKEGVGWISPYRIDNLRSTIQQKIRQLTSGELNIVVLWSDRLGVGTHQFEWAVEDIRREIEDNPETYEKVSGVLFTSGYYYDNNAETQRQFMLFKNDKARKQLPKRLADKLRQMSDIDLKKLQKEHEDIAARTQTMLDNRKNEISIEPEI